ncbi:MAG: cysteine-rich CWC family protein [Bacteroidales bacterium]|nr:cysteine-rich CWC family protein [Bacteroidales bacterium]
MQNPTPKIKTCPSCGVTFECSHSIECWCMAYVIPKENMELIRQHFSDCLCSECLGKYAVKVKESC